MARITDANRELIHVHPSELHAYWPYVRPRLGIVARRSRARWLPEDVYAALKAGSATLHIGETSADRLGFVVLSPSSDFDGAALCVWALFSEEKSDVIAEFEEEIVNFARQMGARRIVFTSPRGWNRRLARYGYMQTAIVFEKEV